MTERDLGAEGTPLSDEDRDRMATLHEEVMERVAEMSQVIARTLAQEPVEEVKLEDIRHNEVTLNPALVEGEERRGVRVPLNTELAIGCYIDPPGICIPCHAL